MVTAGALVTVGAMLVSKPPVVVLGAAAIDVLMETGVAWHLASSSSASFEYEAS